MLFVIRFLQVMVWVGRQWRSGKRGQRKGKLFSYFCMGHVLSGILRKSHFLAILTPQFILMKKTSFILCVLLTTRLLTNAQTLQQVTDSGNITTKSIVIRNAQGLNIGVDGSVGYTVNSHFLKPSPNEYRTIRFDCSTVDVTGGWEFYNSSTNKSLLYVRQSGNIGIGTANPQSLLAVNGTITAGRVKVTQAGWADFVFHPDYQLPSLAEVEAFIQRNRRLAGIPSEAEVKANGVDMGEVQAKLLQKIEELTLYMIDLNKKMEKQQQQIATQQQIIEKQQRELQRIKQRGTL